MKKRVISFLLSLSMIAGTCLPSLGSVQAAAEERQVQETQTQTEAGTRTGNLNYFSNQGELNESAFVQLPMGAVEAKDWLKQQLYLQKNGLTGAIHDEYALYGENNGWRGGTGDGWEKGAYYLRGLASLAWVLDDDELKTKAMEWIDFILDSQRENGFMGPLNDGDGSSDSWDWWPRMVILQVIRDYYEATELEGNPDQRVLPFFEKYFRYQLERLPGKPLNSWAASRGGDNIEVLLWYYNRAYDEANPTDTDWMIDLASILASQTKSQDSGLDWNTVFHDTTVREHVVNTTQAMKTPAVLSQLPGHEGDADSLKQGIFNMGIDHGRVDNLANADEAARENYPYRGAELCSVVESLLSNEISIRITGESWLGDQIEQTAYNNLPAGYAPDYTGHNYFQAQNQVLATHGNHEFDCDHGDDSAYGAMTGFECCFPNMHMGWPKFVQSMWMATKDNGLAVVAYGPNKVTAKVADGRTAVFDEVTDYPFKDTIALNYSGEEAEFPLKLRLPAWCDEPEVTVNGTAVSLDVQEKGFAVIDREWKSGDQVVVTFPMKARTSTWYNNSKVVEYGPLIFALKVEEDWRIGTDDAAREIQYDPVGEFDRKEVYPASDWNYGLVLEEDEEASFEIVQEDVALQPFTLANAPITMKVKGQLIPQWKLKGNVVPEPPYSPIAADESLQTEIELVPYGCTRLRVTQMPFVGETSKDGITVRTAEDASIYEEDGTRVMEFDNLVMPYAEDYSLRISYTGTGSLEMNINQKYEETIEFDESGSMTIDGLCEIVPGTNQYFCFGYGKYNNIRFYGEDVEISKIEILPVDLFTQPEILGATLSKDGASVTLNTNIDRGAGFYTVRYGTESGNYTKTAENFFERKAVLTGLTPGEDYYFQVSMLANGEEKVSNEVKAEKSGAQIPSFQDDFSSKEESEKKWTVYDPDGAVAFTDGSLQVGRSSNLKIMAGTGDEEWENYAVEASLKGPENPQRDFGIMFRCTNVTDEGADSYQGYYVGIDAIGNGLNIGYANGAWNDIAKVRAFTYEPGKTYDLKILVYKNQFQVYVDGVKQYELTDSKFPYGAVGLRSWNQPFEAEYFKVRSLTTEEEGLFDQTQEPQEPEESDEVEASFEDDFEDEAASAEKWRLCGDRTKMQVTGGKFTVASSNNVKAVAGEEAWKDYVAEVSVSLSGTSTQNAGLMYRVTGVEENGADGYNGYYYGIGNNSDGTGYFILGYADGEWHQTMRKDFSFGFETGKEYRLKAVVCGERVALYLDDEMLVRFVDNRYANGMIGVRSYEKPFTADNVTVRPLTTEDEAIFDGLYRYVDETFGAYKTIQLKFPKFSTSRNYKIVYGTESGNYTNEIYNLNHWRGGSRSDKQGLTLPENDKDYYVRIIALDGKEETVVSDEVVAHTGDRLDIQDEMDKLSVCLEEAEKVSQTNKTEESRERLNWAIQNAKKVAASETSNLIDVRLAKNCLMVGMNELAEDEDAQVHPVKTKIEAETASLTSPAKAVQRSDASGGFKVGYIDNQNALATFTLQAPRDGVYRVEIASGSGTDQPNASHQYYVNGKKEEAQIVHYQPNGWDNWTLYPIEVELQEGENTLTITHSGLSSSFSELDYIVFYTSDPKVEALTLDGTAIEGFDRETLTYQVKVEDLNDLPEVDAVLAEDAQKDFDVDITQGETATVTLTHKQDQTYSLTYQIRFYDDQAFDSAIVNFGADPYVTYQDGYYYYVRVHKDKAIYVSRAKELNRIAATEPTLVYEPSAGEPNQEMWAPEIHFLNGKWYIYYTAGAGSAHRMYVLESKTADALGEYEYKGKLSPETDRWAIDQTVLELNGELYAIWSGWEGTVNVSQRIYIARMSDPMTITGERVELSRPEYDWELDGTPTINEGPQIAVSPDGVVNIIYSASGSWTDSYCLGRLTLRGDDPMDPESWEKGTESVFHKNPPTTYSTGHACFVPSPDGTEEYIIFHATRGAGQGWNGRGVRTQKFTWNEDGTPNFGTALPYDGKVNVPSGTEPTVVTRYEAEEATLLGNAAKEETYNSSAGQKVTGMRNTGDGVSFQVNAEATGAYKLYVGAATSETGAGFEVQVNQGEAQQKAVVNFNATAADGICTDNWMGYELTVSLTKGKNTITVAKGKDKPMPDLDYMDVELLETVTADKSDLQTLYTLYKEKQESYYTPESWAPFAEALSQAKALLEDENADQTDVDKAVKALSDAAKALVGNGSGLTIEDLEEAVRKAEAAQEAAEEAQRLAQEAAEEAKRLAQEAKDAQLAADEAQKKAESMANASKEEREKAEAAAKEAAQRANEAKERADQAQKALEAANTARDTALEAAKKFQEEADAIRKKLQAAKDEIKKAEEEAQKAKEEAERLRKEAEESARLAEEALKKLREGQQEAPKEAVKKGQIFTCGKLKVKVTSTSAKTVSVSGVKNKKLQTVMVPATVSIEGETYRVTAVAKNAFKGCSKLRKVTLGKNITSIGKNAFSQDKRLKSVMIKSKKITSVGKNAFKGINKKAVIRMPGKKAAAYKRMLKKSGIADSVQLK